jgi:hypothetical protein
VESSEKREVSKFGEAVDWIIRANYAVLLCLTLLALVFAVVGFFFVWIGSALRVPPWLLILR